MHTLIVIAKKDSVTKSLRAFGQHFCCQCNYHARQHRNRPVLEKFSSTEQAEVALRNIEYLNYDRVAFVGGPGLKRVTIATPSALQYKP